MNDNLIPISKITPFRRFCMTIGELPSSYVETMTYYEMLVWFTKYLQETVIPAINNNGEAVTQLQTKYVELKTFIDNYFDNLDVQEEINNKLDDMADQGILQSLIINYLNYSQTVTFGTVSEMLDSEYITVNYHLQTLGYYNKGDGGACTYYVVDIEPQDNYYLKLKNNLYAIILEDTINVDQLGATKSNTLLSGLYSSLEEAQKYFPNATSLNEYVDYMAIQTACDYFYKHIKLNTGKYYVDKTITIKYGETKIEGDGYVATSIQMNIAPSVLTYIIDINEQPRCDFKNFTVMSVYSAPTDHEGTESYLVSGFKVYNTQYENFENIRGYKLLNTWKLYNTWCNTFYHCRTNKSYIAFITEGSDINNIVIRNGIFQQTHTGIYLTGGRQHLIDSCDIEDNDIGIYREGKGDIEITNSYFEDYIQLAYNNTPIDNILITGCSFWIGSTYTRLPSIRYNGTDTTKMSVISCNFELSGNATTQSTPAIASYVSGNVTDYVKPTIINCNVTSQGQATAPVFTQSNFDGICIEKNNLYNARDNNQKYINLDNNATLTLDQHHSYYRFGGTGNGSSTITVPDLTSFYKDVTEYTIAIAGNLSTTNETSFTLSPSSNTTLNGQTTFTLGDTKGKIIKIKWLGVVSSKNFWQIYVI